MGQGSQTDSLPDGVKSVDSTSASQNQLANSTTVVVPAVTESTRNTLDWHTQAEDTSLVSQTLARELQLLERQLNDINRLYSSNFPWSLSAARELWIDPQVLDKLEARYNELIPIAAIKYIKAWLGTFTNEEQMRFHLGLSTHRSMLYGWFIYEHINNARKLWSDPQVLDRLEAQYREYLPKLALESAKLQLEMFIWDIQRYQGKSTFDNNDPDFKVQFEHNGDKEFLTALKFAREVWANDQELDKLETEYDNIKSSTGTDFPAKLAGLGYRSYQRDQIEINEGVGFWEPEVHFKQWGIIFEDLESLRVALVNYWNGLPSPGSSLEEDLNTGDESYNQRLRQKTLDATFLSAMREFVDTQIIARLSRLRDDWSDSFYEYFDYNGSWSFHKTSVRIKKINWRYELELGGAYTGTQREIWVAKSLNNQRWIDSWEIFAPMNASVTPWTFYISFPKLKEIFGLNYNTHPYFRNFRGDFRGKFIQILQETDKVRVIFSIDILTKNDSTNDISLSRYYSSDEEAIWWPLPRWVDQYASFMNIKVERKDGIDRHDPLLRQEIEWLITKYKAIIEAKKDNK